MTSKQKALFIALGLVLVVGIVLGVAAYFVRRVPSMARQLPPNATPVQVTLSMPGNNSTWPLNAYIPVKAITRSNQPIQTVDLYVNGALYNSQVASGGLTPNYILSDWSWQPGSEGKFTLMVRATDVNGRVGVSNMVYIKATAAAGAVSPVIVEAGQSVESLAQKYGATPESIIQANPGLQPGNSLPEGSQVNVPVDIPVVDPPPGSQQGQQGGQQEPAPDVILLGEAMDITLLDNLDFQYKLQGQVDVTVIPPPAPKIWGEVSGCDAVLSISSQSQGKESGFYIYRAKAGDANLERIATVKNPSSTDLFKYTDPKQAGQVTYTVAAFNTGGESSSGPVYLNIVAAACQPAQPAAGGTQELEFQNGISLFNGVLFLEQPVEQAYVYVSVNGGKWDRVPEGQRNFLKGSGYTFDLKLYLDGLIATLPDTDLEVDLEVWGWDGFTVKFIGKYHYSIHRTVLSVCSQEGENACSGGGEWVTETNISPDKPLKDQIFAFQWKTSSQVQSKDYVYQMASAPFADPKPHVTSGGNDLIDSTMGTFSSSGGGFKEYLSNLYPEKVDVNEIGWLCDKHPGTCYGAVYNYTSSGISPFKYPPGTPFTLYVRVAVLKDGGNKGYSLPNGWSNTVALHFNTPPLPPQGQEIPLASELPSLYDVKILPETYKPPTFLKLEEWGCVTIDGNYYTTQVFNSEYDKNDPDCNDVTKATCLDNQGNQKPKDLWLWQGRRICPAAYEAPPDADLGDLMSYAFGELVKAYDTLAKYFNEGIGIVAGYIAQEIGCDACAPYIKAGLSWAVASLTGLPPYLPEFEEMASQGAAYAMADIINSFGVAGIACDESCQTLLKQELFKEIKSAADKIRNAPPQPACVDAAQAKKYGKQPLCLPAYIKTHPASGGADTPGLVKVRITRRAGTEAVTQQQASQYRLDFSVLGTNTNRKGTNGKICDYTDPYTYPEPAHCYLDDYCISFGNDELSENLYKKVRTPIPYLEKPGDSIDIPIPLILPGVSGATTHARVESGVNIYDLYAYCEQYADLEYVFFKGKSHMKAVEVCPSTGMPDLVTCGGQDTYDVDNPPGPTMEVAAPIGQPVEP